MDRSADAELEKIQRFNCILLKAVKIVFTFIFCCLSACSNLQFRSSKALYPDLLLPSHFLKQPHFLTYLFLFYHLFFGKDFFKIPKTVLKYKTKMKSHQKTRPFDVYCVCFAKNDLPICSWTDRATQEEQHKLPLGLLLQYSIFLFTSYLSIVLLCSPSWKCALCWICFSSSQCSILLVWKEHAVKLKCNTLFLFKVPFG